MALDVHCSQRKDSLVKNFHQPISIIISVNYQCYIYKSATRRYLNLPSPSEAGWIKDNDEHMVPVKIKQQHAPETLLNFTRYSCKSECLSPRCKCKKEDLVCTDVCLCDTEICEKNRSEYASMLISTVIILIKEMGFGYRLGIIQCFAAHLETYASD